jgi:hypothetical protein
MVIRNNMKIVRCKWFHPKGFQAIILWKWLILKPSVQITSRLINHEEIHETQQKEMLFVFFFLWYGIEWLCRLIQYRNTNDAYRNISLEREAYTNQDNVSYLQKRKHFAWIHFINNKH